MNEVGRLLIEQGYWLYREHFPWGATDGYKNEKGEFRFVLWFGGEFRALEPSEMLEYLQKLWTPFAEWESNYKEYQMERDFKRLQSSTIGG